MRLSLPQLRRVFGIVSISPVYTAPLKLEEIEAVSLQVMQALPALPGTFKMNVRRVNKSFPHDSQEMNRRVSAHILRALPQLKVNLHQPDIEMRIELREDQALIYCRIDEAAGGFPFGSNGKAMLMLSGGIDSPVAGYLAMRQGLKLEAVHFHSFPYTSERSQQKVKDLVKKLSAYAGPVRLHMVPLTEIQTKIHQHYKENLYITLLRRAMMRIAQALAERTGSRSYRNRREPRAGSESNAVQYECHQPCSGAPDHPAACLYGQAVHYRLGEADRYV